MPKSICTSTTSSKDSDSTSSDISGKVSGAQFTSEQIRHWSGLIANGEAAFPVGLTPNDSQALILAVGRSRRKRLVSFIAHAIAQDILRSRRDSEKSS